MKVLRKRGRLDHGGSRVGSEGGVVVEVGCEAGEASSRNYQGVESSNKLGQICNLNFLATVVPRRPPIPAVLAFWSIFG